MSVIEWSVFIIVVVANIACSWYWLWISRKNLCEAEEMARYIRAGNAVFYRAGQFLRMGLRDEAFALLEPYERDHRNGTMIAHLE